MLKKALSLLLSLAMIASLLALPVLADELLDGAQTVTLGLNVQSGDWEITTYKGSDRSTYYTVEVTAGTALASFIMNSGEINLNYDENVLDFRKADVGTDSSLAQVWDEEEGDYVSSPIALASSDKETSNKQGYVKLAFSQANGTNRPVPSGTVLATLRFVVLAGSESCNPEFNFTVEGKNNIVKGYGISHTVVSTAKATAAVKGVDPTIKSGENVTLDKSTVDVDGTTGGTVQAGIVSKKGTDLTTSAGITWSVTPASQGVTIGEHTGAITVGAKAKADTYTVTATADGTTVLKDGTVATATKTFTVTRNTAAAPATLEIGGGQASIAVPDAQNTPASTTAFTATVKDQYGDTMSGKTIVWSINGSPTGVSVADGVVSVTNKASAATSVTLKAVVSGTNPEVSDTETFAITKATAVPTTIAIGGGQASIEVPADAAAQDAATTAFTATVYDQFGDTMSGQTVTWTVKDASGNATTGITVSNGVVTVAKNSSTVKDAVKTTTGVTYTVTAACGDATKSAELTVKRAASVATSFKVSKSANGAAAVALTSSSDTVIIPASGSNTYAYYVDVLDQYGKDIGSATTTFETADTYVTFSSGTVTVAAGATKDTEYSLKYSYTNVTYGNLAQQTLTITAKDIEITAPTVTPNTATYGMTWAEIIPQNKITGGSAKLNGVDVAGTFTLKETGTDIPSAGSQTFSLVFNSTDETYKDIEVTSTAYTVTVSPKAVSVTMEAKSVTYGDAVPTYTWTLNKNNTLVGSDTVASLGITPSCSYAVGTVVGSYDITGADSSSTDNYAVTVTKGTLTVSAKPISVDVTAASKTYGDSTPSSFDFTLAAGSTLVGNDDLDDLGLTLKTAANAVTSAAGTYDVVKDQCTTANYTVTVNGTDAFTINPASLMLCGVTMSPKTYNGKTDDAADYVSAISFDGLKNSETLTRGTDYTVAGAYDSANAGDSVDVTITVTLKTTNKAKNYTFEEGQNTYEGSAVINPTTTTLTINAADAVYNGNPYSYSASITKTSNVEDTVTYTYYSDQAMQTVISAPTVVGTYYVKGYIAASGNASEATATDSFKIKPITTKITLTADSDSRMYDGTALTCDGYSASSGLVSTDAFDAVVTSGSITDVGSTANTITGHKIMNGQTDVTDCYSNVVYASGTLTVTKRSVTLTSGSAETVYDGTPLTNDSVEESGDGFVSGEGADYNVTGSQTDAGSSNNTFTYELKDGTKAGNYTITKEEGTLTVEQLVANLVWDNAETYFIEAGGSNVTATVGNLVGTDEVAVTVAGGQRAVWGEFEAKAVALTGAAAKNYALPVDGKQYSRFEVAYYLGGYAVTTSASNDSLTCEYDAASDKYKVFGVASAGDYFNFEFVKYDFNTVGTLDLDYSALTGETKTHSLEIDIPGLSGKYTITVDTSGVVPVPENVALTGAAAAITIGEQTEASIDAAVQTVLNNSPRAEYLAAVAKDALISALSDAKSAGANQLGANANNVSSVDVTFRMEIVPVSYSYENSTLALEITPIASYDCKDSGGDSILAEPVERVIPNSQINGTITLRVGIPQALIDIGHLYVKHYLGVSTFAEVTADTPYEILGGWTDNGRFCWGMDSFSPVEIYADTRYADVTFIYEDESREYGCVAPDMLGDSFTETQDTISGFKGWKFYADGDVLFDGTTFKTLTEAVLDELTAKYDDDKYITATPVKGGSSSSSGGGTSTYAVKLDDALKGGSVKADKTVVAAGDTVTLTVTPDAGYALDTLKVLDADGKAVKLTKVNDTTYTFVMPAGKVTVSAAFTAEKWFLDVKENDWFYDEVRYVFDKGLMNGTSADCFTPNGTTTRGMIFTILARNAGVKTAGGAEWYVDGMNWAKEQGISDGTAPMANITREQLATMLYRVAKSNGKGFTGAWMFLLDYPDASEISSWADEAMHWCVMKGIINGKDGKLVPGGYATRAEVAAMLMRFLELDK